MRIAIKKSLQVLTVLILALTFIGLGVWQLQRAQELKAAENVVADTGIYPLSQKASPTGTIPAESVGKQVSVTGHYMATYKAPNQKMEQEKPQIGKLDYSYKAMILQFWWCADYGMSECNRQETIPK